MGEKNLQLSTGTLYLFDEGSNTYQPLGEISHADIVTSEPTQAELYTTPPDRSMEFSATITMSRRQRKRMLLYIYLCWRAKGTPRYRQLLRALMLARRTTGQAQYDAHPIREQAQEAQRR